MSKAYISQPAALPALKKSVGVIVNIASESGLNGYLNTTAYCASKGLSEPYKIHGYGISSDVRVNALCPGVIETDMTRAGFAVNGDKTKAYAANMTPTL